MKKIWITAVMLVALGLVAWVILAGKPATPPPETTDGNASSTTGEWKTYRNEIYGFELQYPASFVAPTSGPMTIFDDHAIIQIVTSVKYPANQDPSVICPVRPPYGESSALETINVVGKEVVLCVVRLHLANNSIVTNYSIDIPKEKIQDNSSLIEKSYFDVEISVMGDNKIAQRYKDIFKKILSTLRLGAS